MYMRELTTFIMVADQGSFLKAAQELYITPASVMNQMNKLESLVGAKLIERTNHGTSLTAAGRSIYQDAKQMIDFAEEAMKKAQKLSDSEQTGIRIGTSILRPCKRLIDLWNEIDEFSLLYFRIDAISLWIASTAFATASPSNMPCTEHLLCFYLIIFTADRQGRERNAFFIFCFSKIKSFYARVGF